MSRKTIVCFVVQKLQIIRLINKHYFTKNIMQPENEKTLSIIRYDSGKLSLKK